MSELDYQFQFKGDLCRITQVNYADGNPGLQVLYWDKEFESWLPYATLSVNLPEKGSLPPKHYYIKTWSENAAISNYFRKTGLFVNTDRVVPTGHVVAEIWRLK